MRIKHAHPGAPRPRQRFMRPDDARLQIERAIALHEATFGSRPVGHVAVGRLGVGRGGRADRRGRAAAGSPPTRTSWRVRSNVPIGDRPDLLYRPYRVGDAGPVALFRDHAMSDRIGFHYQSWDPVRRGERLHRATSATPAGGFREATGGEVAHRVR